MKKNRNTQAIIIIFSIFLILFLYGEISNYCELRKEYKYLETLAEETTGIVKEVKKYQGSSDRQSIYMEIDYEIDGKEYRKKGSYDSKEEITFNKNEQIVVLYDKDNPDFCIPESILKYQKQKNKLEKTENGLKTIFILIIMGVLYIKRG